MFVRYYDIERPDEVRFEIDEEDIGPFNVGSTVYMSNLTTRVKMYAIYNDMNGERKEVDVLLRAGDFSSTIFRSATVRPIGKANR